MSLLKMIAEYDRANEEYIQSLEARIQELEDEREERINESLRAAQQRSDALLSGILSGVISKPKSDTE